MKPSAFQWGRFLLTGDAQDPAAPHENIGAVRRPAAFFKHFPSAFLQVRDTSVRIACDPLSLRRLLTLARETGAGLIYADYIDRRGNAAVPHPLIDWQEGALRNDFSFGPFFLLSAAACLNAIQKFGPPPVDPESALYDLRLKISVDHRILHVPESLYTVTPNRRGQVPAGQPEKHFDYLARENAAREKRFEKIATQHLRRIGAYLPPRTGKTGPAKASFPVVASVIIPVLNREKTLADALQSALSQKTDFPFNVIVVDNHSTDGTAGIIRKLAAMHPNLVSLRPKRRDLGIGGCWNEAVHASCCGRYAVQLDSDDLYSTPAALQKIVDTLQKGSYAMVVGAYTIVNEKLKTIFPGRIDHREWTQKNGHNNLLRVNGLGAPRAFDTALLRRTDFPNVSYGEDYAVALNITRAYAIGRIYESLYWCRRWTDNTDAGLSLEKQNRHNHYKDTLRTMEIRARQQENRQSTRRPLPDSLSPSRVFADFTGHNSTTLPQLCLNLYDSQKRVWPKLRDASPGLALMEERNIDCGAYQAILQFNPARAVSTGAAVDAASIQARPCFLCADHLPDKQMGIVYRKDYLILCNPAPIFKKHFTIATLRHQPQEIIRALPALLRLSADASPDFAVFYNGPAAGASAPDHLHFQMIPADALPFLNFLASLTPSKHASSVRYSQGFDRSIIVLESRNEEALMKQFLRLMQSAQSTLKAQNEPMVNVICVSVRQTWRLVVFLRRKHRPDAYFARGENRILISPGAIDMAGVVVTPRKKDFERLDRETIRRIYREVSLDEKTLDRIVKAL
ncbi:MAG: DUF4922 domain-containing protein [Smithellaceae bacterium]